MYKKTFFPNFKYLLHLKDLPIKTHSPTLAMSFVHFKANVRCLSKKLFLEAMHCSTWCVLQWNAESLIGHTKLSIWSSIEFFTFFVLFFKPTDRSHNKSVGSFIITFWRDLRPTHQGEELLCRRRFDTSSQRVKIRLLIAAFLDERIRLNATPG